MNFYNLIKQQYNNYKIEQTTIDTDDRCEKCPCKTIRDKTFKSHKRLSCLSEIVFLMDKYNIRGGANLFFCGDCRRASVRIAKILFEKECINKI